MSIYSDISKRVGWDGQTLRFPTLQEAVQLRIAVASKDEAAFEKVFRYHRFLPSATNDDDRKVQTELWFAYKEGTRLFS